MESLIDKHAPIITRIVTTNQDSPWYTESLREAKREKRKLERKWLRTKKVSDRKAYRKACVDMVYHTDDAKTDYYSGQIASCEGDQKSLFNITNKLLNNQQASKLPPDDDDLPNKFNTFFNNKISDLRDNLTGGTLTHQDPTPLTHVKFDNLRPTNTDEVRTLIKASTSKSCELDPLPTWILKLCLEELLPILTNLFNTSL